MESGETDYGDSRNLTSLVWSSVFIVAIKNYKVIKIDDYLEACMLRLLNMTHFYILIAFYKGDISFSLMPQGLCGRKCRCE